eukprot:97007_1
MCPTDKEIDIVVLVDVSGNLGSNTNTECQRQQLFLAEIMSSFKDTDTLGISGDPTQTRVSYMLFGPEGSDLDGNGNDYELKWSLTNDINVASLTIGEYLTGYYYRVKNMHCGEYNDPLSPTTNLYDALNEAFTLFTAANSDGLGRDKKIVILSNRPNTNGDLCDLVPKLKEDKDHGVDIVMINIVEDENVEDPFSDDGTTKESYESCLVFGDVSGRIVSFGENKLLNGKKIDNLLNIQSAIDTVQEQVCEDPSPSPTTDPTADPTSDPTTNPTNDPTTDPTRMP